MDQLRDAFSTFRAVTLTGPGGIGKTALALEVARNLPTDFDDGRWLVDLASLSVPRLVPAAVAAALGPKPEEDNRKVLVVIDNCEHVIDAAARLAETIIQRCPFASVLATSREVLGIEGEYVFRVPSLVVPASDQEELEDLLERSAVALFIVRARSLNLTFSASIANRTAIAFICRKPDGIPLAIELAAVRAAELSVGQVAESLESRFDLLAGGRHTTLPRHQTLSATLDWSFALLKASEQQTLCSLAVLSGPFTLQAADKVTSSERLVEPVLPPFRVRILRYR